MGPSVVLLLAVTLPAGQPTGSRVGVPPLLVLPGDEAALKAASLPATPMGLLDFFRRRAAPAPSADHLADLVRKLGDSDAGRRDQALAELIGLGQPAVPALRAAVNNADDRETASRARTCLQAIEGASASDLTKSSIRLLAAHRPPGTTEVLLAYLPIAEDDQVIAQIQSTLLAVGLVEGKPDEALGRALSDPVPLRRAVAAAVLARIGGQAGIAEGGFARIRPLLKDPRPSVRLRVALALVENNDPESVPILIDLIAELPAAQQKETEEHLTALAGEWSVGTPRGNDVLSRQLRRDLWQTWWRNTDGTMLLRELRSRTVPAGVRAGVLALVQKLDSEAPEEQEKASEELLALGARVVPVLRRALARATTRQKPLLDKCLQVLEKDALPPLPAATPRLLALRRPEGTLSALLDYIPDADNPDVVVQLEDLIGKLGWRGPTRSAAGKSPARPTRGSPGRGWLPVAAPGWDRAAPAGAQTAPGSRPRSPAASGVGAGGAGRSRGGAGADRLADRSLRRAGLGDRGLPGERGR